MSHGSINAKDWASDVISLQDVLSAPVTAAAVSTWAGESPSRHSFLATTVWCAIRWPKELGVPNGPSFPSGFNVTHDFWQPEYVDSPAGIDRRGGAWKMPLVDAVVSGSAQDGTHYSTSILMHPKILLGNRLRVELADHAWEPLPVLADSGPHSYRAVELPEQQFIYDGSEYSRPYLLQDVNVVARHVRIF